MTSFCLLRDGRSASSKEGKRKGGGAGSTKRKEKHKNYFRNFGALSRKADHSRIPYFLFSLTSISDNHSRNHVRKRKGRKD